MITLLLYSLKALGDFPHKVNNFNKPYLCLLCHDFNFAVSHGQILEGRNPKDASFSSPGMAAPGSQRVQVEQPGKRRRRWLSRWPCGLTMGDKGVSRLVSVLLSSASLSLSLLLSLTKHIWRFIPLCNLGRNRQDTNSKQLLVTWP